VAYKYEYSVFYSTRTFAGICTCVYWNFKKKLQTATVTVTRLEFKRSSKHKQESCAIAKMTAQCALHMGALKTFGTPWDSLTTPTALFPTFSWTFVLINPMNVLTKFEVRSFTRC